MKHKKVAAFLLTGIFSVALFTACGEKPQQSTPEQDITQNEQELTEKPQDEIFNDEALNDELIRPAEYNMQHAESYEYPFMGLEFSLPESVMQKMDNEEIAMLPTERWTESNEISYAFVSWNIMTEEQRVKEVPMAGMGYTEWENSLMRVAALGVFEKTLENNLNEATGCTEHKYIGESTDGLYSYYLSTNPDADKKLCDELEEIKFTVTDMVPFQQISAFEMPFEEFTGTEIGEFSTVDINGTAYTQEVFAENELTMVNVFATWCSPCVEEIPHLEKLSQNVKENGVGVIGIVMDAIEPDGLEKAKLLAQRTEATYPFILPDENNMNGKLNSVTAYPTTFFVDKNGNIVGEEHLGANDLAGWTAIVEATLSGLGD